MKFRIAIQSVSLGQYRHEHNVMLESKDIKQVIRKVRLALKSEISERKKLSVNRGQK